MKPILVSLLLLVTLTMTAQDKPYYYNIPKEPTTYTATTVAARLVDGLGFRYFWATEGLTDKDLAYRPSDSARTTLETVEHIYGLTRILLNAVNKRPTTLTPNQETLSFNELREQTLQQIREASELLKKQDAKLENFDMVFERSGNRTEYPFWNLINGPISDALWHVGQVVTFRRSSGNPLPNGVSVLVGRKRD